jgi:hypothetical protein
LGHPEARVDSLAQVLTDSAMNGRTIDLLRMVVSDVRSHLGSLTNGLEVLSLQGEGWSITNRRTVDLMSWRCQQLNQKMDRVMEVIRIANGSAALAPEILTLSDLIAAFLAEGRPATEEGRVEVVTELPAGPVWLEVDRLRLVGALGKVFGRAALTLRSGRGLRVRGLAGPRSVRVDVGPVEQAAQGDPEPAPKPERGDLETSLARCLIEQHGGVFDLVAGGFVLELPRLATGEAGPATEILLVDGNRERGRSLGELLLRARYQVRNCEGLEEAASAIEVRPVAVVVVDLESLAGQYRRLAAWSGRLRRAGVVRLVGLGNSDELPIGAPAFDVLLAKPYPFDRLETAVRV